jgi:hypothetical protein
MAHKDLSIKVTSVIPDEQLHELDKNVAGSYSVKVSEAVPEDKLADAALDIFHLDIPIKVLDDFSIEVFHGENVLLPSDEHENGSLEGFAYLS